MKWVDIVDVFGGGEGALLNITIKLRTATLPLTANTPNSQCITPLPFAPTKYQFMPHCLFAFHLSEVQACCTACNPVMPHLPCRAHQLADTAGNWVAQTLMGPPSQPP